MLAFAMPLQVFASRAVQSRPTLPTDGIWIEKHENTIFKSLKQDVSNYPTDFITFETQASANRFIVEHQDAQPEVEHRISSRGIVGYWHGKTLVVLPSLPIGNRSF